MLGRLRKAPRKEDARQRQIAVWNGMDIDRLPILFGVPTPGLENGQHFDMKECYENRERMLFETLYAMISQAESPSDSLPVIRANTGTGTLACCFGLKQEVFPDKMPWLKEHLTKDQIARLEPDDFDDVSTKGIMPQVLDYQRYFRDQLDGAGWVILSDTQGPMDIAHLVRGDDIFLDMYDDPPFVHNLMELALAVYVAATKAMKANLEETFDMGAHVDGVYLANGAVRVCEDTPVILSPHLIETYVVPYTKRALAAFGGGYVHYCGRNDFLFHAMAEVPEVHGFNFGMPQLNDMEQVMSVLLPKGKVYYGIWTRNESESLKNYFQRIMRALCGSKRGLILVPELQCDEVREPQSVIDLWAQVQYETA